jgi:hypothetical protein
MTTCSCRRNHTKTFPPAPEPVKAALATLREYYYGSASANRGGSMNPDGTLTYSFHDEGPRDDARVLFALTFTPEGPHLDQHRGDLALRLSLQDKLTRGEALTAEEAALKDKAVAERARGEVKDAA